jgi:GntR family transcriptional regulator
MRRMGRAPGSRVLTIRYIEADEQIAQRLALKIGDSVLQFSRIRLADGTPISIENAYLNGQMVRGIDFNGLENFSLYLYLRNTLRIPLARAVESIETTILTGKRAQWLEVPENTPGLLMNRVTYDDKNRAVEYAQSYYRGDIYKFVIELRATDGTLHT